MKHPTLAAALIAAVFSVPALCAPALGDLARAQSSPGALRPEVGKPLERAKALMAAHNCTGAMAQVNLADRVRGKSANESFVITEMRGAVAQTCGDRVTAARAYQQLIDSGRVQGAELQKLLLAEASMAYQNKDYARTISWIQRYQQAGGRDPAVQTLLIQSYYENKDYANAGKLQAAVVAQEERAGKPPTEVQLQLLANCQQQTGDKAGFLLTMEKLVYYYPKPDYWANVIGAVRAKPGFSDLLTLDVQRLQLATGTLKTTDDYMQMAQLALTSNAPGEALDIINKGYQAGLLGTGPEAPREARLKALAEQTVAARRKAVADPATLAAARAEHDGNRLQALAEEIASLGDPARAVPLMLEAQRKDALRHPDIARLHLGLAYLQAGQKAQAIQTLRSVNGADGTRDLAQLWILKIERS
jgi:tetratricopeptide (TPR) repeat protein